MRRFGARFVLLFASFALVSGSLGVATATASAATGSDPTVTIQSTGCGGALFCFTPANVTVTDGGTVTWTNNSGVQHTVTRCNSGACSGTPGGSGTDGGFASATIGASNGSSFSHTFHGAGTYNYYCTIHGFGVMHGTVTVVAATTATTAAPAVASPGASSSSGTVSAAPQSTAAATSAAPTATASNSNLPRTGSDEQFLISVAIVALGAGLLAVAASRRRPHARARAH